MVKFKPDFITEYCKNTGSFISKNEFGMQWTMDSLAIVNKVGRKKSCENTEAKLVIAALVLRQD